MRRQVEENDGTMLIRLPSGLKKRFEAEAARRGCSVAALARASFELVLEHRYGISAVAKEEVKEG